MNFQEFYQKEVMSKLKADLAIDNPMAVPRIVKVVVNVGAGEAVTSKGVIDKIVEQIGWIAGQRPVITLAKKSVSAFKIRRGYPIGVKVTLRRSAMYTFLEKLVKIVLPRFKDFRGIAQSAVDGHGNLNIGFTEQTLFPEIEFDKIDKIRGLQVTVVTTARDHARGIKLFEALGVPFKKEDKMEGSVN